ncbi:MAG: TldD/PmbA family protein [Chloroflexota bacterium]
MTAGGPEDGVVIAARAVSMALDNGATQAEALVMRSSNAVTRFADNQIHQNVADDDTVVNIRFIDGQRVGVASGNDIDESSLRRLSESAATIARLQPERSDFRSLPRPRAAAAASGAFAAATAEADPELRADAASAVIAAAEGLGVQAFGLCQTSHDEVSVVNSLGVRVSELRSNAQVLAVMTGPRGGSGYAERVAVDISSLDASAIGQEAAQRTIQMSDPVELPAGDYPVVLDSYAVMDIADMLGYLGFSGLAVQEERSFFEPGKRVASPLITLVDDAADTAGTPASFDYEGVPTQRVTLLDAGVCRDVVHDTQTASREGLESSGHGLPAPNPWGPFPTHLGITAGQTSPDELIGGLERGLLVTRFHYTNVVHPKQVVITGMTRDGLFLVEDGKITTPVRNLRFTQCYLDALAAVEAVGAERRTLEGFLGTVVVPALRLGSFSFTGTTVDS